MLRLLTLLLLLPLGLPAWADVTDFSGTWVAWICPAGVARESGKCSNFVLELHQQGSKLCGAHFYATAGATSVDEGAAPSISGDIAADSVDAVAISSRPATPVRVHVELTKRNGMLHWQRIESPPGDYLLPRAAKLSKSAKRTLFMPVFEQELKAACLSLFTMSSNDNAGEKDKADKADKVDKAEGTGKPEGTSSPEKVER